jgi:hypothetical protein
MGMVLTWPVGRGTCQAGSAPRPAPLAPVAAYVLACGLGGALTGSVIAQLGAMTRGVLVGSRPALLAAAGLTALVAVACEWRGQMRPLPERRAQVPRRWLQWRRPALTAAAFGLMIGSGVLTYLKHAAVYALAAMILVAPSVSAGALIGAIYGSSRGMTVMLTWVGDRFLRRRPPWPKPGSTSTALNRSLAVTALISAAIALAVTP